MRYLLSRSERQRRRIPMKRPTMPRGYSYDPLTGAHVPTATKRPMTVGEMIAFYASMFWVLGGTLVLVVGLALVFTSSVWGALALGAMVLLVWGIFKLLAKLPMR